MQGAPWAGEAGAQGDPRRLHTPTSLSPEVRGSSRHTYDPQPSPFSHPKAVHRELSVLQKLRHFIHPQATRPLNKRPWRVATGLTTGRWGPAFLPKESRWCRPPAASRAPGRATGQVPRLLCALAAGTHISQGT